MALNRYSKSSRFTPDTTGPDGERVADPSVYGQVSKGGDYSRFTPDTTGPDGERVADPKKMGKISPQGTTKITSWPELRDAYDRGELPDDLFTGGHQGKIPKDVISYMNRDTNILSEKYAEPEYSINPDTQEVGHYRDPADPKFTLGDIYGTGENTGKKNVYHMRYDAENKQNRSRLSRAGKDMSDLNYKLSDYIQGDISPEADGSAYTEAQLAGLYPDMQLGGGVGMSDFGQSAYAPSKKQIAEEIKRKSKLPPPPPLPPTSEEKRIFDKEGPVRMPVTKATLDRPKSGKIDIVGNEKTEQYTDPLKPDSPKWIKGQKKTRKSKIARKQSRGTPFGKIKRNKIDDTSTSGRWDKAFGDKADYRKEGRLAKATYGRGLEDKSAEELQQRSEGLKERRREQASIFKREDGTSNKKREDGAKNKITGMHKLQLFKNIAVNKEARQEGRDINRAQKYREMVGGSDVRPLTSQTESKKEGQPKYFKPAVMKNFRGSDDNPLNRNSSSKFFR